MLEVLTRITEGKGRLEDIETIKEIAAGMQAGALCALGQLTPGPVLSALRYFEDEFIEHIVDKKCRAGTCTALVRARCTNACPAEVDVPSYVSLVAQGRYAEALEIHRRRNPFALVCGRVCPAFCEARCRRGDIDEPMLSARRVAAGVTLTSPSHLRAGQSGKSGRGRRRTGGIDGSAAPGPEGLPSHCIREAARTGRDDGRGHSRLSPAA